MKGAKKRGRQKKRWEDNIKEWTGMGFGDSLRAAEDREGWKGIVQDQDQDSLLVKRQNDNHSPGPVIRELVPSSHQRSELSNTILCIFSG